MSEFDYIIIGAGSAGCVLANKLGQDTSKSILILEAGPVDRNLLIHIPAGVYSAWRNPKLNWNYQTEPEPNIEDRKVEMPRGKVVGGSSSINSMVYMRGHPLDFDAWASDHGLEDWSYAHCLPYFRSGETYSRGGDLWRGNDGPLGVSEAGFDNALYDAFLESGKAAGQGFSNDLNGFNPEGVARLDATRRNGRRCSAAVAHLRPALARGNVTLLTDALVQRIVMSGRRAIGVAFSHKGTNREIFGGEILLSGGAINSPQLLMISGIGPRGSLESHGIECHTDLAGVGQNLMDHASVILQYACTKQFPVHRVDSPMNKLRVGARWVFFRDGIGASNIWEAGGLIRSAETAQYPDIQYHFGPVGFEYHGEKISLSQAFSIHVDLLRPKSRGRIELASAFAQDAPKMWFNYLAEPNDLATLVSGVRKARELVAQAPFDPFRGAAMEPSSEIQTEAEISHWVRRNVVTDFHPCGTCKMGADNAAVVDERFRVHGIDGLRVVDASVFPMIPSANLNAPTQMVAARAADYIMGQSQLAPIHANFAFS